MTAVLPLLVSAVVATGSPGRTQLAMVGKDWVALARGSARVTNVSFAPGPPERPGLVVVYGFALSNDDRCRTTLGERVPQPDAKGAWGPYPIPAGKTLCVATSGGSGTLRYRVESR